MLSSFLNSFNIFLNSSLVCSQKLLNIMYHIFSFSKSLDSTEGIVIFCLVISLYIKSGSQDLIIFRLTTVQAGHFIYSTASLTDKSCS